MSVEDIKRGLVALSENEQRQVTAFLCHLRHRNEPQDVVAETRYDTAHGYPHQDILDKDENTLATIVIPTDDLDEAFHHAINDLKTHAHRYLKAFGQD